MSALAGIAAGYLAGSLPAAWLAGRLKGIDPGQVGSGNYGATNVYRTLGAGPAALVLAVDVLKGYLPTALLPDALPAAGWPAGAYAVAIGVAAVLGHVFSVFLGFRGGKGVGTAAGAFLALAPIPTALAAMAWLVVLGVGRIVSVASLSAAVVLAATVWIRHAGALGASWPLVGAATALLGFVFWTHRANVRRLARGEEPRVGRPRPAGGGGAA